MALNDPVNITWPNANVGVDTTYAERRALVIEQYSGIVEGTIARRSILEGIVPVTSVRGTDTVTNRAVGESTLQKVVPGEALNATKTDFGRNSVTVDTVVAARDSFALLEQITTNINVLQETGTEHGKKIAKFYDQSFLIQAIKAARRTQSSYNGGVSGKPAGHFGGSQETLAAAGDLQDPVKLYAALARLLTKFELKDVDPRNDGVIIVVNPAEYYTLIQAEQLVNASYVTASGNQVNNGWVLKTYGVPVFSSNNLPKGLNVTGHLLSNSGNGNAYDGDFTKLGALAFAPKAIMAAEAIPLATDIFYDKIYKCWFVDAHLSYAVGPNRCEYAGTIELP